MGVIAYKLGGIIYKNADEAYKAYQATKITKTSSAGLSSVVKLVDPKDIRFTQDSIKSTFQDGGSVQKLVSDLKSGVTNSNDIPPIRIFEKNGKIYSLDNRRLKAFKDADIPIRTKTVNPSSVEIQKKFTTKNDGQDIKIRGE